MTEKANAETSIEAVGDRDVIIERTFRAPARLVFEAYTRPEYVSRWWSPRSCTELIECVADVRVGGKYRYVVRSVQGDVGFSGVYQEIVPPTKVVYTQVFEPMAEAGSVVCTATFDEKDGATRMVLREVYPSKEARDAALASGMDHGIRESYDQLDAVLAAGM